MSGPAVLLPALPCHVTLCDHSLALVWFTGWAYHLHRLVSCVFKPANVELYAVMQEGIL